MKSLSILVEIFGSDPSRLGVMFTTSKSALSLNCGVHESSFNNDWKRLLVLRAITNHTVMRILRRDRAPGTMIKPADEGP